MTLIFLMQLLLTFAVGTLWIYFTTIVSNRFGSKTGGFVGGLPSTALLSFFFIGLNQSPEIASASATVFPLAYGSTAFFLVVYALLVKYDFTIALFGSLFTWLVLSAFVAVINPKNYAAILIIYFTIFAFVFYLLEIRLGLTSRENISVVLSKKQAAVRAIFGGSVILLAVLFAKIGGPVFGAVFASFPAMFISILAISYKTYGKDFSMAMTKPLMVTGMITIVVYAITVKYTYVEMGLYLGTIIAIIISGISAYLLHVFILRKMT